MDGVIALRTMLLNKTILKSNFLTFNDLGLIDYEEALKVQKETVEEVINGGSPTLIFCEHPAVLTLGRLGSMTNILWPLEKLAKKNIKVISIDRGGEVTLHCPGQLVVYPIINLSDYQRDLKKYLSSLEQVVIDLLHDFGIVAKRIDGQRGVWVGKKKIASVGIGVRKWVTYHGIAINVNTDLSLFSMIKPCGLNVQMTSMAKILGRPLALNEVKAKLFAQFHRFFSRNERAARDNSNRCS